MGNICNILGVPINNITHNEAVELVCGYLNNDDKKMIFTPNPEFVMSALKDEEFMNILNKGDLLVPDGIGVVIASKILGKALKERVAGYDLVQAVFNKIKDNGKTVYFLGGGKGIAEDARAKMEDKHKGIKIVGVHDGYFDENEEKLIIEEINRLKPDLVLVGIGFPKQEKWIYKHKDILEVKVFIGVGGSFDGMSGNVKRAPDIFIKLGLEWFYRLVKQPSRFFRMLQLPLFLLTVIKAKIKGE